MLLGIEMIENNFWQNIHASSHCIEVYEIY